MKIFQFNIFSALVISLISLQKIQVSGQYTSAYGGPPIVYTGNNDDDDLGILLTVLLLASQNRNNCCGNCCKCCGSIPVPYPIPIPINNPIITTGGNYDSEDEEDDYDSDVKNRVRAVDPPEVPKKQ